VRLVDESQYINRLRSSDFDMIIAVWPSSESPGNEQREFWTSAAADSPAASNYAGIKDPVIDELVELVISAPDRDSLVARTRALDRVLLFGYYVIPNWHVRVQRILHWDKFGRPGITPRNGTSIAYWWLDAAKAPRLEEIRKAQPQPADRNDGAMPGLGVALAVVVGAGLAGFFVFRRVWLRTGRP
jgi:microcin C transport system substrate-binding protein